VEKAGEEKVKMTVMVPRSLWKRSKLRAVEEERDLRELVIDALERYLAEKKGGKHGAR
jgi:RNA polymerase-interacting CarD/CdnL/TRCF family regulator